MDCHRCVYLRYDGCPHCVHPDHLDVKRERRANGRVAGDKAKRAYSKEWCADFKLRKRCSNCKHWRRGEYFGDGMTPARKGHCSLRIVLKDENCPLWEIGPTSWRKRRPYNKQNKIKENV